MSLFEFKGDIRNFFFLFILWNLTKTINRGVYTRFTNNCNNIDSKIFFLEFGGFRGIGNIFGGVLFWWIGGWCESRTDIHPSAFTDCCWVDGKESNSIEEFTGPWSCWGPMEASIFLVCSYEDGIKEKRRGLIQYFVDDVWVFQWRWCLGFARDFAKWNESEKCEVPIYW